MKTAYHTHPNTEQLQQLDEFVFTQNNTSFFQSSAAFHFFETVDNYTPQIITIQQKEEIVGSLLFFEIKEGKGPKGFFSRRSIIIGGPVLKDDLSNKEEIIRLLLKSLNQNSKSIYSEFRNHFDLSAYQDIFEEEGFEYNPHLNFIVSVEEDEQKSLQLLNSSKRRQVRKSIKNGASIKVANTVEEVKAFYDILKELYTAKVKKPLPDWLFFKQFFLQENTGIYLLIFHKEKVIGGIMCPIFKDTIYEWYIAGLDGQISNVYPSILATWAPIQYAAQNGLRFFDFMGAGKPDEDYGVREFKSKFGGELVEYGRFIKINQPMLYQTGKLALKMMQKLK
jgi:serine/alanine adding enzyme